MKKFIASLMTICLLSINTIPALANCCVKDVPDCYWAAKEINDMLCNDIMDSDEYGNFNPEKSVTRVEFVQALLRVLSDDCVDVTIRNNFTDVAETYPAYQDILRSQQLGLVYGYPDRTFKPERVLLKSEVTSILSHITKETVCDTSILNQFVDVVDIPVWAIHAYAKTTKYGLCINYPDARIFLPNKELSRAEAAVLLSKLKCSLCLVKDEYRGTPCQPKHCPVAPCPPETTIAVEHLNVSDKAPVNTVTITNYRKIICEKNLLAIAYECPFNSKCARTGDIIKFVIPENLYTCEGTLIFPACTKIVAEVIRLDRPKWFNKNARVGLKFQCIILPDGRVMPICAKPFTKDCLLKEGPWMTAGKIFLSTVTFGILGAGTGVGFGFIPSPTRLWTGLAIGIPVGAGVGLLSALVTKGLQYKTKCGEQILIIITQDTSVYN